MKTWRKEISLLLVGMMMMTGLVAISAPAVIADTIVNNTDSRFQVDYDEDVMQAEMVYDVDLSDLSSYVLGERDGDAVQNKAGTANTLTVNITCLNDWLSWNPATLANVYITNVNVNITGNVQDLDFNDVNPSTTDITGVGSGWNPNNDTQSFTWQFDILKTSGLGVSAEIPMRIWWSANGTAKYSTFNVRIYFSSVFDQPGGAHDNYLFMDDAGELNTTSTDTRFEAGDAFEAARINMNNYGTDDITNLAVVVTPPVGSGISLREKRAWFPNGIAAGMEGNATYRVDVVANTDPGIYHGKAAVTYNREDTGDAIVETPDITVEFLVNYNFYNTNPYPAGDTESIYQCYASSVTLLEEDGNATRQEYPEYQSVQTDQSTFSDKIITFRVNITNNGNADLNRVTYMLDITNPLWDYFRNPQIYYSESSGPATINDALSIMFNYHNVSDVVSFNITVIVAKEIPIGEHRLPIIYDGFFFDNGTLGDATNMTTVNGGNGLPAHGEMDDLELVFSIWVNDGNMDCRVTAVNAANADKGDIRSEIISVDIMNMEGYSFIDIRVTADFTGTPFYAPLIDTTTGQPPVPTARNQIVDAYDANPANVTAKWGVYNETVASLCTITVHFRVDTDSTMPPDRYPFTLTITAIIENTLDEVTATVAAGAEFDFTGYGPDVYVTAFTADDIVPGQNFNLALTLQNVGDDTLRDVYVTIQTDGTDEYNWSLESSFKTQFDWSKVFSEWGNNVGGGVTWNGEFPEDMFYTLEDLDVDNVREIVEINLYMDGVYSLPSAKIACIHILDLAPGASIDVTFEMLTDKDMVNGKPYDFPVSVHGINTDGENVNYTRMITVQSSLPGDQYNPVELNWFDAGLKALALFLFFIIVLAILLFVYNMFKGDSYDEDEEDFDFEDEEPFEPTPAPPAKRESEELVEP